MVVEARPGLPTVDPGRDVLGHDVPLLAPGSSVADLVDLMDEPRYPSPELTETHWEQVRYGDYEIQFEVSNAKPG